MFRLASLKISGYCLYRGVCTYIPTHMCAHISAGYMCDIYLRDICATYIRGIYVHTHIRGIYVHTPLYKQYPEIFRDASRDLLLKFHEVSSTRLYNPDWTKDPSGHAARTRPAARGCFPTRSSNVIINTLIFHIVISPSSSLSSTS